MNEPAFRRRWLGFLLRFLSFSFVLGASVIFFVFTVPEYAAVLRGFTGDVPAEVFYTPICVVIDPGHGGEDGGCSSDDGILEKDLNLQLSTSLADLCRIAGLKVVMTRESDTQIYDLYRELDDYTGHKKVYDLRNRLRLTRENDAAVFVSLHMNRFSASSCHGTQVYYSPNDSRSRDLAGLLQNYTRTYLQPENDREIKRAGSSIFLLKQLELPAVLVECGFLSNSEDAATLSAPGGQRQMALTLFCALSEYLSFPANRS